MDKLTGALNQPKPIITLNFDETIANIKTRVDTQKAVVESGNIKFEGRPDTPYFRTVTITLTLVEPIERSGAV